jgi:hypothetical protein
LFAKKNPHTDPINLALFQLNKLYNEEMLDIMEISKIHCRAPGGILSRLKMLKYITHRQLARGYDLYKKSNFYKQAIQINKENYKNNLTEKLEQTIKNNQVDNTLISICKNDYIDLQHDVVACRERRFQTLPRFAEWPAGSERLRGFRHHHIRHSRRGLLRIFS